MINTQVKFPQFKRCCIHKKSHNFFSFKANEFDLEGEGKRHQFSKSRVTFTRSINGSCLKTKFLTVKFLKNLNQNFGGIKANFALKIKVKVTNFRTRLRPLCGQYMVQV